MTEGEPIATEIWDPQITTCGCPQYQLQGPLQSFGFTPTFQVPKE